MHAVTATSGNKEVYPLYIYIYTYLYSVKAKLVAVRFSSKRQPLSFGSIFFLLGALRAATPTLRFEFDWLDVPLAFN